MDIINFISWVKEGNVISTVPNPSQTLIPIGLYDSRRGDSYLSSVISVTDFANSLVPPPVFSNDNTPYGSEALANVTTGEGTTAMGIQACLNTTTGNRNTAFGAYALRNTISSSDNTAIGYKSMRNNTTGIINTAVGTESLFQNTTGIRNVAIGHNALIENTTGSANVAVGTDALVTNVSGVNNSVLGDGIQAGVAGSYNCIMGYGARALDFNSSIVLGTDAAATANNQFVVGSTTYTAGVITTETIASTRTWTVRINGVNRKILLA